MEDPPQAWKLISFVYDTFEIKRKTIMMNLKNIFYLLIYLGSLQTGMGIIL
jgi:hypothetical protein